MIDNMIDKDDEPKIKVSVTVANKPNKNYNGLFESYTITVEVTEKQSQDEDRINNIISSAEVIRNKIIDRMPKFSFEKDTIQVPSCINVDTEIDVEAILKKYKQEN